MVRKHVLAVMTAAVIGMAMFGGRGLARAHDGEGASSQAGSAGAEKKSELCPVSGEEVDAKSISYEYKGKVYHFCCASCVADFKKDPEKYIKKMKGEAAPEKSHDHGNM
ncbi:MAG TPA: YHS domain-containing protein [Geobacteraceae bacterium]